MEKRFEMFNELFFSCGALTPAELTAKVKGGWSFPETDTRKTVGSLFWVLAYHEWNFDDVKTPHTVVRSLGNRFQNVYFSLGS